MTSNLTSLRGLCPAPFLDAANFPSVGGNVDSRLCAPVPQLVPGLVCCLPCPFTDWIYPPNFSTYYTVAEALAVGGLVICLFLLLSWAVLPAEKTRRHYLSICLTIGIIFIALAFVIPLGTKPPQCHNEITPNDMHSNLTCAFTGAFVIAGGLIVTVWIFIRALSMHLQICWEVVPGKRFFYFSQVIGWGVALVLFVITMAFTGVSFRFGETCHVNSAHSLADFWGPLLGIAAAAGLIQIMTFVYCIKVYIQNMWSDEATETTNSTGLPSYTSSTRAHSIRTVYRRMKKVLWLQWRSITIVIFLLVDLIFFAIIWIQLDNDITDAMNGNVQKFMPFLLCLFDSHGEKSNCYKLGQQTLINENVAIAILMLLALSGVQTGLLMARSAMFVGWWELITRRSKSNQEFVSLDAKRLSADQRAFELYKIGSPMGADTEAGIASAETYDEHAGDDATREWRKPTMSFAGPRAPSNAAQRMNWEQPLSSQSRGGLGLHPPRSPSPNPEVAQYSSLEAVPSFILPKNSRVTDEHLSVRFDVPAAAGGSANPEDKPPAPRHFI